MDASKVLLSPDAFHLKLKEAIEINNIDYDKFKKTVMEKTFEPSKEWIEKQKDEKFQNLFKQLWPNVYSRINTPEPPHKPASQILAEIELQRMLHDQKLKQDFKYTLAAIDTVPTTANHHCCSSNVHSCNCLKVCQVTSGHTPHLSTLYAKKEPVVEKKTYPNVMSSYDFPWQPFKYSETLVKSSYNPASLQNETNLLKEIQESQEKLKANQKLEKTTDLVDDMISKFKLLQDDMKKKSEALRLKSELSDLKQEIHRRSRSRSKSRSRLSSDSDMSSRERTLSHIRPSTSTYSILKKHTPICSNHSPSVSFSSAHKSSNRKSFDSDMLRGSRHVNPKVKCWNCNCTKTHSCAHRREKNDMNIY